MAPTPSLSQSLEQELTCSICTDLLFDAITFLDCLHTNCGSCSKSWFSSQATNRNLQPTCPTCRQPVRETRLDSKIASILEDYLRSNPTQRRSDDDIRTARTVYKPGDKVVSNGAVVASPAPTPPSVLRFAPNPPLRTPTFTPRRLGISNTVAEIIAAHGRSPRITCDECMIEVSAALHYECTVCSLYHLCTSCFRNGKMCPGRHLMLPQQVLMGASLRLQTGMFCDLCDFWLDEHRNFRVSDVLHSFFWQCTGGCNNGDWKYCMRCVRRGNCCDHKLQLYTNNRYRYNNVNVNAVIMGPTPGPSIAPSQPLRQRGYVKWTTFETSCDLCRRDVLSGGATTWYCCPECHDGNRDICNTCSERLPGYRECGSRHKMMVFAREGGGVLRVMWRPKLEKPSFCEGAAEPRVATALVTNWPPAGGGSRELRFPVGALVRDVMVAFEESGVQWFWGSYCGKSGIFKRSLVRFD